MGVEKDPARARDYFRTHDVGTTAGWAPGYAQANLIAVDQKYAFDFLLFAQRNPKPCPIIDVLEPGQVESALAPGSDLRTDIPGYRVWRDGVLTAEVDDATEAWTDDLVAFLIGCSFSFEAALLANGVPVRHIEDGHNVPMYRTTIACQPAGRLSGPMVVSMRPMPANKVVRAVQVTSRFPSVHGAPVHVGDPRLLGIADLAKPDFGEPSELREGEVLGLYGFMGSGQLELARALSGKLRLERGAVQVDGRPARLRGGTPAAAR